MSAAGWDPLITSEVGVIRITYWNSPRNQLNLVSGLDAYCERSIV